MPAWIPIGGAVLAAIVAVLLIANRLTGGSKGSTNEVHTAQNASNPPAEPGASIIEPEPQGAAPQPEPAAAMASPNNGFDLPAALSEVVDSQGAIGSVSIRWREVRSRTSSPTTLDDACLLIMSRAYLKEKPLDLNLPEFKEFRSHVVVKEGLILGFSNSLEKLETDQVAMIKLASAANNKHRGVDSSKEAASVVQSVVEDYRDLCDKVLPGFF
ncbi:MAG TPA: hypothetical protein PKA27_15980 [Fimbriimonadaceae bacterium]|nr:hypothetical protein [Fimbriimonadaceae bacterium]